MNWDPAVDLGEDSGSDSFVGSDKNSWDCCSCSDSLGWCSGLSL